MAFKDETLTFEDTKILNEDGAEVMMNWEAVIMEKSAEYVCHNNGDILEIGFGMGICSDYIQSQGVNSHTIIEIHPEIIERLKVWADALGKAKSGAKITYWNNFTDKRNEHSFDSVSFDDISVTPDDNTYFTSNTYHMPKVEL